MGWLRNAPKNPMREWRGGLPVDGGFQPLTEYEIGARKMFEKGQSILQSLSQGFDNNWESALKYQKNYMFEKLEQLIKIRREYARDVYIKRFVDVSDYKPQYKQQAAETNLESVESIKKNAASILLRIDEKLPFLLKDLKDDSVPPSIKNVAVSIYMMFAAICRALLDSVEDWPDSISNAYAMPDVIESVDDVKASIRKMYREDYFWL